MNRYRKDDLGQMINIDTQEEWDSAVIRLGSTADRIRDNINLALGYVEGERQTIVQPSVMATELALTATPENFPRDSYGLAQWLDLAFAHAEAQGKAK